MRRNPSSSPPAPMTGSSGDSPNLSHPIVARCQVPEPPCIGPPSPQRDSMCRHRGRQSQHSCRGQIREHTFRPLPTRWSSTPTHDGSATTRSPVRRPKGPSRDDNISFGILSQAPATSSCAGVMRTPKKLTPVFPDAPLDRPPAAAMASRRTGSIGHSSGTPALRSPSGNVASCKARTFGTPKATTSFKRAMLE
jgi:hypothetical protein